MGERLSSAWLIQWEWVGDNASVAKPYVDIVSSRKTANLVGGYLQRLYGVFALSLTERIGAARYLDADMPPYQSRSRVTKTGIEVRCGTNPYLVARLVRNVEVTVDADGNEHVSWEPMDISSPKGRRTLNKL